MGFFFTDLGVFGGTFMTSTYISSISCSCRDVSIFSGGVNVASDAVVAATLVIYCGTSFYKKHKFKYRIISPYSLVLSQWEWTVVYLSAQHFYVMLLM